MTEEEQKLYDAIVEGGYGTIKTAKIMIIGDIELLKKIIKMPQPVHGKQLTEIQEAEIVED